MYRKLIEVSCVGDRRESLDSFQPELCPMIDDVVRKSPAGKVDCKEIIHEFDLDQVGYFILYWAFLL